MYATFTKNCYLSSYYISLEGSVAHLLSECQALRRRVCGCLSHPHILPIQPFSTCKRSSSSGDQTIGSDWIVGPHAWTQGGIKSESAAWIEIHKIRVDEQIKSVKIQKNSSELFFMFWSVLSQVEGKIEVLNIFGLIWGWTAYMHPTRSLKPNIYLVSWLRFWPWDLEVLLWGYLPTFGPWADIRRWFCLIQLYLE